MNINFKKEEIDYLLDVLERDLTETKTEVHHTASHTYKEELKEKSEVHTASDKQGNAFGTRQRKSGSKEGKLIRVTA